MNKCRWEDKKFIPCSGMQDFFEKLKKIGCQNKKLESGELFTAESECSDCGEILAKPIMWCTNVAAE